MILNEEQAMAEPGAMRLPFDDGFIIVQVIGEALFILLIVWKRSTLHFRAMLSVVNDVARKFGCSTIEGVGRAGWKRKLLPLGFAERADGTIFKELSHGR